MVLLAAMFTPEKNDQLVQHMMQKLGKNVVFTIARYIEEMKNLDQKMGEQGADTEPGSELDSTADSDTAPRGRSLDRDTELQQEERYIEAVQKNRLLEARIQKTSEELEQALQKVAMMQKEIEAREEELYQRGRRKADDGDVEHLRAQSKRDRDYIADLESDVANLNTKTEQQERQLERLQADAASKQQLKDELQALKLERDDYLQKAKAVENLKKKIQTLQDVEKANVTLREDYQSAVEQLPEVDRLKERNAVLQKANEESMETIANTEQEIFDQKTARKRIEHELSLVSQKYEQTRELLSRAEEAIRDHESRIRDLDADGGKATNLDAELEDSELKDSMFVQPN